MTKKTCACCDYPLEPKSTIKVKIGGKTGGSLLRGMRHQAARGSEKQKKKA